MGLKSLKAELSKLTTIKQLALPTDLFKGLNEQLVAGYQQRVETESLTEIRRHPDPIRYLLLSSFCHQRSQEIVDSIIELFILLVHRLESRSRRQISSEIVATAQENKNHDQLLYQIAVAALAQPEGTVQEVIYPVANEAQLETVVEHLGEGGKSFKERLHAKMRRSYTHYYRRLLPLILKALEFRSDSLSLKPLLAAIELLKASAERPSAEPYSTEIDVPMDGVLSAEWQDSVMVTGKQGEPEIDRASYELGVLRTVREKLRCKELWVVGAKRYRNPDDDLPQDFEDKREQYYLDLQQPLEAAPFIDRLQAEMTAALTEFNQGLPDNSKVTILNNRGVWIHLTPVSKQPEPKHSKALKQEITRRWSMVPLLDVLKETEMRLQFTEHFKSTGNREALAPDELRKRLLLCLYAAGTNLGLKRISHCEHGVSTPDLRYVQRKFVSKHDERVRQEIQEGLNVVENWNSANDFIFYAKNGDFTAGRVALEISMLSLHLLQISLVYINTLLIQQVLADPVWMQKMGPDELRALTPLIYAHVNPYGVFRLDLAERLLIEVMAS